MGRGNLTTGEATQRGHRVHARAQNFPATVAAPNPTPPPVTPVLKMNKDDDDAPHKLFNTIRHLTGRVLSPDEWVQWCQGLDKWTAGLSQWALDREKSTSPQQAWSRRQTQKSQRNREVQRSKAAVVSEKEKQRRRGHNMGETGPSPKWPTSNVCITGLPVSAWRALDTLPSLRGARSR